MSLFHISKLAVLAAAIICGVAPVMADKYYDAGYEFFRNKKYSDAARYFEESIKNAPWESGTFYYCALSYHYMHDMKKAADKYYECAERFPGTPAANSSLSALNVIDPGYMKRKAAEEAARVAAGKAAVSSASATASVQDKGSIEGPNQVRLLYRLNGSDKVVSVRINGRNTVAIFDPTAEGTVFSREQLSALAINPQKGASEVRCELSMGALTRKNFPVTLDSGGAPARIGNSFLDAFNVTVNEGAKSIDLTRRTGAKAASENLAFSRDGKDLLVNAQINGRNLQMIFDPNFEGITMTAAQARNAGLKVDEAETEHQSLTEGPQRGDPNWVPPDERVAAKQLPVRLKLGGIEQPYSVCKITEQGGKFPRLGGGFLTGCGYNFEVDYKSSKIVLSRK